MQTAEATVAVLEGALRAEGRLACTQRCLEDAENTSNHPVHACQTCRSSNEIVQDKA